MSIYYIFDGEKTLKFSSYIMLINWISQYNCKYMRDNTFIRFVGNNPNDVTYEICAYRNGYETKISDSKMYYRTCRVYDEDWNSIFDARLVTDVLNWEFSENLLRKWRNENTKVVKYKKVIWALERPEWYTHHFRREPFPDTGVRRFKHKKNIRTTNEHRQVESCELPELIRAKRNNKNLPTTWDTGVRCWRNRGWKSQSKNRHQWESRIRNNTAGIYDCKASNKRELAYTCMELDNSITNDEINTL